MAERAKPTGVFYVKANVRTVTGKKERQTSGARSFMQFSNNKEHKLDGIEDHSSLLSFVWTLLTILVGIGI
jgi:hypothetical protein